MPWEYPYAFAGILIFGAMCGWRAGSDRWQRREYLKLLLSFIALCLVLTLLSGNSAWPTLEEFAAWVLALAMAPIAGIYIGWALSHLRPRGQ